MKNRIKLISFFIIICNSIFSQESENYNKSVTEIDSLIKIAGGHYGYKNEILLKALKLSKKINYKKGEVRSAINLGVYYMSSNKIDSSYYYFNLSSEVINKHEELEKFMGYIYHNKAVILTNKKLYSKALRNFNQAYKVNLKYNNVRLAMTSKLDMLECYLSLNKIDSVLNITKKIKHDSIFTEGKDNYLLKFKLHRTIARAYFKNKEYQNALKYWEKNKELTAGTENTEHLLFSYLGIAKMYKSMEKYQMALDHIKLANYLIAKYPKNKIHKTLCNQLEAIVFYEMGSYEKSLANLDLVIKNNKKNPVLLTQMYDYAGESLVKLGRWKEATHMHVKYKKLMDSLNTIKDNDIASFYSMNTKLSKERYHSNVLKLENKLLKTKTENQKLLLICLLIISLSAIFIILIVVFIRKYSKSESKVKALKINEQNILKEHIKQREEELLATAISVSNQIQQIRNLKSDFSELFDSSTNEGIKKIKDSLSNLLKSSANINMIYERIEYQYPNITSVLEKKHPELTQFEIRHCLLLKLNLTLKESAQLLNVSTHAIKMARNRIKKKINLPDDIFLRDYLKQITS